MKPIIEMRTQGPNWRKVLHQTTHFVALCTPAWQRGAFNQRQLAYARHLGKPIYFLVPHGTPPPTYQEHERVYYYADAEDCAQLVREIAEGTR